MPFRIVSDPQQLKAFTDPLRVRVLKLRERAATNQQLAVALGTTARAALVPEAAIAAGVPRAGS